ncbi:TPA: sel1 repeat family protein, partial [Proteus mirabilis]|nr:sel1 repeat family protein [Proteus mirabilis]
IDAIKFIITKEYKDKNARDEIYQDYSFDKLTNITIKERLAWRRKCADLGDFICLKELAIIYRDGKEGVRKNIAKASEYERRISINSSHFELESEKYEIDRRWKEKRDNTLDYLLNQKESSKQQLELARFYSIEDSGRSLIYAKKAYDLGNKEAAELIYWYYMQNICEDKDNINKADYYLKEWLTTGEEPSKYSSSNEYKYSSISIIADYYLESPCLVERNLDKAIE